MSTELRNFFLNGGILPHSLESVELVSLEVWDRNIHFERATAADRRSIVERRSVEI